MNDQERFFCKKMRDCGYKCFLHRSRHCKTKKVNKFTQSLTFVTLVFLALKGGQGVNRPESKTDLMSSPLLH